MVQITEKAAATAGLPVGDHAVSLDESEKKGPYGQRIEDVREGNKTRAAY